MHFHGQRITVMGLGHFGGGTSAARWLARRGALVTVTDLAGEQDLADSLVALKDVHIARFHLGGHREEDFRRADVLVVNPAVRPGNPLVELARQSGARITTEIELFMEECPAPIIGVTGSNGKSTTTAMTAAVLRADGKTTWLGGNIGRSLLDDLPATVKGTVPFSQTTDHANVVPGGLRKSGQSPGITADDWVVLEISSFQLWYMNPETPMPRIAVITSCTPNHLDWHASFPEYAAAKQRILLSQAPNDLAVLNTFDPEVATWAGLVRGQQLPLLPIERLPKLTVPGRHSLVNAACAVAAAQGAGCGEEAIREGLRGFHGLPQRLEWFAVVDGRRFYNDSTATTPESTNAALESLEGRVWLLAGGRDKGFDYRDLAATIVRRAAGAAFFGAMRESLQGLASARNPHFPCVAVETMREALAWCWARSKPGDLIVLSPACSSHDQFRNFRQRGEQFAALITELAQSVGRIS